MQSIFSTRQFDLKEQIDEATNLNQPELVAFLQSKWVHRYGLKTFEELLEPQKINESDFNYEIEHDVKNLNEDNLETEEYIYQEARKDIARYDQIIEDVSEENLCLTDSSLMSQDNLIRKKDQYIADVPPPPRPTLSHLRRWLPKFEEEFPEAS